MKQRIYIDTSVFGGYHGDEFSEHTIPLFDRLREGEFTLLFSTVTQEELENAPDKLKRLLQIFMLRILNLLKQNLTRLT